MNTTPAPSALFDLTGKRVLVTGASRGIGQALAVGFAQQGANVIGAARTEEGLKETAALVEGSAGSFEPHVVDLRAPADIESCVRQVAERLGGIDVLVNNAADDHESSIEDTSLETFQRVVQLNLQSCWVLTRAAAPYLKEGGGKIINIASVLGLVAIRDNSAYVAAKHGLVGLTRAIALEWARKGVQINAICPGYVETAMLPQLADEGVPQYIRRQVPMGRWSQPEEFVGPATFLASAASDYMTGQVLVIDGGMTAQ
ncbi:SDR family NAD(P)-dependent oxidoreductase [Streptomyces boluensis]|uniref:SDR family oxidoreductase n=1 Tax=Streptomyces boluensis TaxID=1775135 RepID=A0A964UK08_9ACTN|nr:SDR family oxidoreductase [Streptomyces boluensis]NBE49996.1 SDR family oxidoreductase [Streptomyces boluensis]